MGGTDLVRHTEGMGRGASSGTRARARGGHATGLGRGSGTSTTLARGRRAARRCRLNRRQGRCVGRLMGGPPVIVPGGGG
jgi:hypothetical protein